MGNRVFLTVLSLSLSGTLTGILIMCIRPLTKKIFSKKWNYYVWLVMIVRLLIPFSLGINLVGSLFAAENMGIGAHSLSDGKSWDLEGLHGAQIEPLDEKPSESMEVDLRQKGNPVIAGERNQIRPGSWNVWKFFSYLGGIWIIGVFAAIAIKWRDYRKFAAYVRSGREEIGEEKVQELAGGLFRRLGIKKNIKVYESALISGPIMMGLFHPCIVLPKGITLQEDISLILHHELIHYKKKDLWYKWLYQAVLCIHWFNPYLYLVGRKLNVDCELACDEAVMKVLTLEGRKAYGNVLLDAAEHKIDFRKSVFSTTLLEDKNSLKERLSAICHYKKTKRVIAMLSAFLFALIFIIAGAVGAQNGKGRRENHEFGQMMAGGYVSGWDTIAAGYVSFWDRFGEAVNDVWDGLGEMWGNLGDMLLGDFDSLDLFLSQNVFVDTHGESWNLYEDDQMIAGADIHDIWHAYNYAGNGGNVDCKGLFLNGSDTYEILYAKKGFTQTLDFEVTLLSGKMKLVHVGADGKVTVLSELEKDEPVQKSVDIPLTEGRNVVKIVGQGAKIKSLKLRFGDQNHKNILKLFTSDTDEAAEMLCDEFRRGDRNISRFMDALPYMKDDDISECAKILFDTGADLTIEQISELIIYGNAEVGKYLSDAVEKGTMKPFTGEEIVDVLVYYVSSPDLLKLVENMEGSLDFDMLEELLIYLDAEDGERCLDVYLKQGNKLSYQQFSDIGSYLNEDTIRWLDEMDKVE